MKLKGSYNVRYKGIQDIFYRSIDYSPIILQLIPKIQILTGIKTDDEYEISVSHKKLLAHEAYCYHHRCSLKELSRLVPTIIDNRYNSIDSFSKYSNIKANTKIGFTGIKRVCRSGGSGVSFIL